MKLSALSNDFKRCNIAPTINKIPFTEVKTLPRGNGLYSIWQDDVCIYVGQGSGGQGIRGRFIPHHINKANDSCISESGRKISGDPIGWQEGRKLQGWDPSKWTVEFFECHSAVHRTYLEGAMLLLFDPLCNDESFADRVDNAV